MKYLRRLLGLVVLALCLPQSASGFVLANGPAVVVLGGATLTSGGSLQIVNIPSCEVDLSYSVSGTVSGGGTLTFTVAGSDPQNATTTVTGDTSASSAGIVATNSTGTVVVSPLRSSAVTVSWTVSTGSFAGVDATLSIKSAVAQ